MKILKSTLSICPKCRIVVNANVFEKKNEVFITKNCEKHGRFVGKYVWSDYNIYKELGKIYKLNSKDKPNTESKYVRDNSFFELILPFTQKCNLNCPICFVGSRKNIKELNQRELLKLVEQKPELKSVALSEMEPTTRKDLVQIIKKLKKMNLNVSLITNGVKLSDLDYAKKIKESGIDEVAVSFDGLTKKPYMVLRGQNLLEKKLMAIDNLKKIGIPFRLSFTLMKGVNDDQIGDIIDFCFKNNVKRLTISSLFYGGKARNLKSGAMTTSEIVKEFSQQCNVSVNDILECCKKRYLEMQLYHFFNGMKTREKICGMSCYLTQKENGYQSLNKTFKFKLDLTLLAMAWKTRKILYPFRRSLIKLNRTRKLIDKKVLDVLMLRHMDLSNLDFDLIEDCSTLVLNSKSKEDTITSYCLFVNSI